ncbi:MAG: NAD(P)H-hydrate dehydratase, partial [Clostridia bacterium]|nr:NAD(P)H-hydrate dehydratase [Clostridia bacterium]
TVVLTPHPLEFARLSGNSVDDVQLHRIEAAMKYAAENRVILALKGAATVITDGKTVYINSSGSSALSKAGSGDVLAGFTASLIASGADPFTGTALSVYLHGAAADSLSSELSAFSITPSDLPIAMGRQIASLAEK